jgi:hypothetical protein
VVGGKHWGLLSWKLFLTLFYQTDISEIHSFEFFPSRSHWGDFHGVLVAHGGLKTFTKGPRDYHFIRLPPSVLIFEVERPHIEDNQAIKYCMHRQGLNGTEALEAELFEALQVAQREWEEADVRNSREK